MDDVKQQVADRLKQANNILVTVRSNPNVDLLSACIGLALALDKLDKHAAAVFSGQVPSTIEFLKPEATIEQTPDSLRDFIIALDKSKADKLRYKVEDDVVRIFITPYKTSITEKDLEFSQGDFNVDAVVALGAHEPQELDQAITAHGRILHDATVISINNTPDGSLGTLNWQEIGASSISEMVTQLVMDMGNNLLDEQIATALLTGIVAETVRFSNDKTTPRTMNLAGELMAAGANQQLVATELQATTQPGASVAPALPAGGAGQTQAAPAGAPKKDDGTLEIDHAEAAEPEPEVATEAESDGAAGRAPGVSSRHMLPTAEPPHIRNVHGSPLEPTTFTQEYTDDEMPSAERSYLVEEPTIPANTPKPADHMAEPSTVNPYDIPPKELAAPLLNRDTPAAGSPAAQPAEPGIVPPLATTEPPAMMTPAASEPAMSTPTTPAPAADDQDDSQTLEDIEKSVHSPHVQAAPAASDVSAALPADDGAATSHLDDARSQVLAALQQGPQPLKPLVSLNANPLGGDLHPHDEAAAVAPATTPVDLSVQVDADGNLRPAAPAMASVPPLGPPPAEPAPNPESPANRPLDMPLPAVSPMQTMQPAAPAASQPTDNQPPAVPPPMLPPSYLNPAA